LVAAEAHDDRGLRACLDRSLSGYATPGQDLRPPAVIIYVRGAGRACGGGR
jgi:hypothetical protein